MWGLESESDLDRRVGKERGGDGKIEGGDLEMSLLGDRWIKAERVVESEKKVVVVVVVQGEWRAKLSIFVFNLFFCFLVCYRN